MDEQIVHSPLYRGAVRSAGYAVAIFVIGQTVVHIELTTHGGGIGAAWPSTVQQASEESPVVKRINSLLHVIVFMVSRLSVAALCGSADDDYSKHYAETELCGTVLGYRSFASDAIEEYIAEGLDISSFVTWPEILPKVEELKSRLQKIAESFISIPAFLLVIEKVADALLAQPLMSGDIAVEFLCRHVPETLRSEWEQMLRDKVAALEKNMAINDLLC